MVKKVKPLNKRRSENRHSSVMRVTSIISVIAMVVTAGTILFLFLFDNEKNDEAPLPTIVEEVTSCPADDGSQEQQLTFERRPIWCLENGQTYTAIFNTSEGEIRVSLDTDRTPETANNFVVLSRFKYYDNTLLFRFDPSLAIIQGGSPHTNDWSDPGPGYTIPDEGGLFSTSGGSTFGPFTYEAGQLVMARSAGPNSSSAQFFLSTGDEVAVLNGQGSYIVFGETDQEGLDVLKAMMDLYEEDETSPYGGGPVRDVVLDSIEIVTEPIVD
ncbi:MAG: hypothetical protein CL499_04095 [Actinobacteria bacterium]|nr:hypothetical protein [Actinomycetota bacterium]